MSGIRAIIPGLTSGNAVGNNHYRLPGINDSITIKFTAVDTKNTGIAGAAAIGKIRLNLYLWVSL